MYKVGKPSRHKKRLMMQLWQIFISILNQLTIDLDLFLVHFADAFLGKIFAYYLGILQTVPTNCLDNLGKILS